MAGPTPTIAQSNAQVAVTLTGLQVGDAIIATLYAEPESEGTSSARYGTIGPPTGFTMAPAPFPVSSNDANLLTANTQRDYLAYFWVTTAGSRSIAAFTSSLGTGVYQEPNGLIVVRGATDITGGKTGVPWQELAYAGSATPNGGFPSVNLTCADANNLLVFIGTDWDSGQGTLSGWTTTARNAGTATNLTKGQAAAGSTGAVQPTQSPSHTYLTSVLMSFRSGAPSPASQPYGWGLVAA